MEGTTTRHQSSVLFEETHQPHFLAHQHLYRFKTSCCPKFYSSKLNPENTTKFVNGSITGLYLHISKYNVKRFVSLLKSWLIEAQQMFLCVEYFQYEKISIEQFLELSHI